MIYIIGKENKLSTSLKYDMHLGVSDLFPYQQMTDIALSSLHET
jgi:hypothetical protein